MSSRDRRLLRELAAGQASVYRQAVEDHYERIYALLYRLARDVTLAEDLTQDTFAAAWRSLETFEGRSSFGTWLRRIALNIYRGHQRRNQPETVPFDDETLAGPDPTPEMIEDLRTEELQERTEEAVSQLPEIYREAVILRCYQGLKYREVAELLDVPLGTVQHRLHVAFRKLREMLREEVDCRETVNVEAVQKL